MAHRTGDARTRSLCELLALQNLYCPLPSPIVPPPADDWEQAGQFVSDRMADAPWPGCPNTGWQVLNRPMAAMSHALLCLSSRDPPSVIALAERHGSRPDDS